MNARDNYRWLDFSGAPPMLIPARVAKFWRGTTNRKTEEYTEPSFDEIVSDYDRAIQMTTKGDSVLEFNGTSVLVLYTEHDLHAWDAVQMMISCSGSMPPIDELKKIRWGSPKKFWGQPVNWLAEEGDYLLMNAAADGREGLEEDDYLPVRLEPGSYLVKSCCLRGEHSGVYHKLYHTKL